MGIRLNKKIKDSKVSLKTKTISNEKFFIEITKKKIDVNFYLKKVFDLSLGGNVIFVGTVRDSDPESNNNLNKVEYLYYEAYIPMALNEIQKILEKYALNNGFKKAVVVHRIGVLKPGDIAILVALSDVHRGSLFNIIDSIVKEIKEVVPIWKKEVYKSDSH